MINSSEWKEFRIGDIFDIECSKYHNPKLYNDGQIPYVARTIFNNGITQYIDTKEKLYKANCIIIGAESAKAFYQKKDFLTGNKIYRLYLKDDFKIKFNRKIALFICSIINSLSSNYNYVDAFVSSKIAIAQIKLPIKNNKPDFDFMENFIDKIEQKQRGILEFYKHKKQNGGGYELNSKTWKEFRIGDLFDIKTTSQKLSKKDNIENGKFPIYSAESQNGGICGYCNEIPAFTISNEKPFFVIFGDHTRAFNIATNDFCVADNVKVLEPKIFNIKSILFIITIWQKGIPNLGYARHWSIAKNIQIKLPITTNGEIDFDFMESFISGVQKTSIKGVIELKDKIIEQTKKAI